MLMPIGKDIETVSETIRQRLKQGKKEEALQLLSTAFGETIYWQARRTLVVHEDAQDVIQEVFLRIIRSIDSFRWESKLSSWVYRIVANECSRFMDSKNRRIAMDNLGAQMERIAASDYVNLGDEAAIRLQAAIQTLPPKQQQVFNLRYYDDLSYEDIAEIIDSTPTAAKMNYHHAKEKIVGLVRSLE